MQMQKIESFVGLGGVSVYQISIGHHKTYVVLWSLIFLPPCRYSGDRTHSLCSRLIQDMIFTDGRGCTY